MSSPAEPPQAPPEPAPPSDPVPEEEEPPSTSPDLAVKHTLPSRWRRYERYIYILARLLVWGLIGGLLLVCLYRIRSVLTPILIALFLAYALDPLIDWMESRRIPRTLAILVFLFSVFVVAVGFMLYLVPALQHELVRLSGSLPGMVEQVRESLLPWLSENLGVELPDSLAAGVESMASELAKLAPAVARPVGDLLRRVFSSSMNLVMALVDVALLPVFAFYFLRDFDRIKERVWPLVPERHRDPMARRLQRFDEVLSGFIRGQLMVCLILGVLYALGLVLVGVRLGLAIGLLAGLLNIVPYVGFFIGIILALLMALLDFSSWWSLIGVGAVFAVVQTLEGLVITPRIVGDKTGLSPVAVIIALLVGGELAGVFGMLAAVPVAAVLKLVVEEGLERYKSSDFYLGERDV